MQSMRKTETKSNITVFIEFWKHFAILRDAFVVFCRKK